MIRRLACVLICAGLVATAAAQTELPQSDDSDSFEVEPPPLLPNQQIDRGIGNAQPTPSSNDPVELEKRVERAKRIAADAQLLFKRGVLSKMEVEQRALRIVRLQADLENARFQVAQAEFAVQQTRFEMGQLPKEALNVTATALEAAREKAEAAATARDRAEIAAAEVNLQRQRKLAALGIARSSDVARAEKKLADLKAAKD